MKRQARIGCLMTNIISLFLGAGQFAAIALAEDPAKLLTKAAKLLEKGNYEEAQVLTAKVMALEPQNGLANYYQAQIASHNDEFSEALTYITVAATALPQNQEVLAAKIDILIELSMLEDAEADTAMLAKQWPQSPLPDLYQAKIHRMANRPRQAFQAISDYLVNAPEDTSILEPAAEMAMEAEQYADAKDLYDRLRMKAKDDLKFLIKAGEAAFYLKDYVQASTLLHEGISKAMQRGEDKGINKPIVAYAYYLLGEIAVIQKRDLEIEQHFAQALKLNPLLSKAAIGHAHYLLLKQDNQRAYEIVREAYTSNPRDARVLSLFGRLEAERGAKADALKYLMQANHLSAQFLEADFILLLELLLETNDLRETLAVSNQAVEAYPQQIFFHRAAGISYQKQGNPAKALEEFTSALAINPNDALTYYWLGVLYDEKGSTEQATLYYEQALYFNAADVEAMIRLAKLYSRQKNYQKAVTLYQDIIRVKEEPELLFHYANVVDEMNDPDKAIALLNRALELRPNFREAKYNLGLTLLKKEDWTTAEQHFKQLLDLDPTFKEVHRYLAYIYQKQGKAEAAQRELTALEQ